MDARNRRSKVCRRERHFRTFPPPPPDGIQCGDRWRRLVVESGGRKCDYEVQYCALSIVAIGPLSLKIVAAAPAAEAATDVTRSQVVSWLCAQDQSIRTFQCEYLETRLPTPDDDLPRIKEALENRGEGRGDPASFTITADEASKRSHRKVWIRSGVKEYCETKPSTIQGETGSAGISASDGDFARALYTQEGALNGTLSTPPRQHYYDSDRETPYTLTYYFIADRLSDLIERAYEFNAKPTQSDEGAGAEVTFYNVDMPDFRFILQFDAHHRLVRRDVYVKGHSRDPNAYQLYRRLELEDYLSFSDQSGQEIWFPRRVKSELYVGWDHNGSMVPWNRTVFTFLKPKFNEPIPESKFVLQFPEGTKIFRDLGDEEPRLFDPYADTAQQIAAALAAARRDNRRVPLVFGANQVGRCHALDQLFQTDKAITEILKTDYVITMIDRENEAKNKEIDERYGNPRQSHLMLWQYFAALEKGKWSGLDSFGG